MGLRGQQVPRADELPAPGITGLDKKDPVIAALEARVSNGDVDTDVSPQDGGHSQPVHEPPDLPLDFEAFYLGHQEFFHHFAKLHLGSRRVAEQVVHEVFLEILGGWNQLLQEGDLEQQTLVVLHRHVTDRLRRDGRPLAFVINAPIAHNLKAVRNQLEGAVTLAGRGGMIFGLIMLEGMVRGEYVAVVQGAPVPGRGHLPLCVAVPPLPAQLPRGGGADAGARCDRLV
ncbi:hypothetical protein ACIHCQ_41390 [Streptomyces sp. NPDC052236]|uniref:hypothetical protein n=1 Tax=Streptomyces sp. NPDC052236 TaxID=3365686 RepID=UPI0037D838BE